MTSSSDIAYITRDKIDTAKWNQCIDRASNGLIYGYSFYLDHMARQWHGLVLNDYEAVMPLTWHRKYGIYYLYQPFLAAQLGLFGNEITSDMLEAFLRRVPKRFKYWDIYLNSGNVFPVREFNLYQRANYVLDLGNSYEDIRSGYRENITRNIKKAQQAGARATSAFEVESVIELASQQMKDRSRESADNITRFRALYKLLVDRGQATTYGIFSSGNALLASAVFFFSHQRAYYILVGNHPDGRTLGASHALLDAFIKDRAGTPLKLDFEGSDLRNLAFFYSSFGASEEKYAGLRANRLPFYLKWLKSS